MDAIQQVLHALEELGDDSATPKHVKSKIYITIKLLNEDAEQATKASRALYELESVTEDMNLQPYTRTQLFNIVSLLEVV